MQGKGDGRELRVIVIVTEKEEGTRMGEWVEGKGCGCSETERERPLG